jgi:hypothetical protein
MEAETEREDPTLIRVEEAAKLLRMTHWGLRRWVKRGVINCVRQERRLLFHPSDLLRALATRKKSEKPRRQGRGQTWISVKDRADV